MSSAGQAGGYFSDGLLNLFHFDKDLTARRKNPARGLGGDRVISHLLQNLVLGGEILFPHLELGSAKATSGNVAILTQGLKLLRLAGENQYCEYTPNSDRHLGVRLRLTFAFLPKFDQ